MAIARLPTTVLDCPDPAVLAAFYGELLGWSSEVEDDWAEIRAHDGQSMCFQKVERYTAPDWPSAERPQQAHLDMMVDDLDDAETAVLALGAVKHAYQPGTTFRVFLDPAGHPFCLCIS